MTATPLRIGIAGYGLMAKAHCYAYRVAPSLRKLPVTPVVTMMSGRDGAALAAAAQAYGVPQTVTDWRVLVGRDDVDVVDICTPPGTHAEIAQAAAAAGKAVLCEKPLALTYAEAAAALAAVTLAGVHHAVGFNYRRLPAVALMRRMIAESAVGEVRLWRASFLSDEFADPATPYDWRFDLAMGGTTISDLGSHLIDMALWMVGPIASTCAQTETFIRERALPGGGSMPVTVDDAASALLRFESGAMGTLEVAQGGGPPPLRLHGRGQRHQGQPALRLRPAERALVRKLGRRPRALRDAADQGRAPESSVRRPVVADRPGHRIRGVLREPGGRPAGGLAGRAVDTQLRRRRRRAGRLRRHGGVGGAWTVGRHTRGDVSMIGQNRGCAAQ